MPNQLWSQDTFNQGELSPLMYAKSTVAQYYNALKTAQNVLCFPQGGAGKRFGTLFRSVITGFTSADDIFFETFQYLNECTYQILFYPQTIKIYLEGLLIATLTGTNLDAAAIQSLDYTVLDALFRVTGRGFPFPPSDLARFPSAADVITGVTGNRFNLTTPIQANVVLPVKFTNVGGLLPITVPAIKAGITYFAWFYTTTQVGIFSSSQEAANQINQFTISSAGTGTNNLIQQNDWTFTNTVYKNRPVFDFGDVNYDAFTFQVEAVTGNNITLHCSNVIFLPAHIGGAFFGLGGVGRILSIGAGTPSLTCQIQVILPFPNADPFKGIFALLTEPAWSNARGWPQKCSSYQNRALFANTESLPNGFWASSINDYSDFDDTQTDDDDAISWYPTSDDINYIRFIVPYRSLTIHTNSGVYSSPLSANSAITPTNFSLQLNDSTPADNLTPRGIDNQIIVSSGNDVYALVWDGINNAYTSEIVSILNEQVIRNPVDEAAYVDLTRGGSRYVFFINELGSMAIFQTLITEGIKGWTPAVTEQYYGASYFRQVATSHTGRGWFVNERFIAAAGVTYDISGFTSTSLITSAANTFSTTDAQAVKFTTTGGLPVSSPQIETGTYYWVIAVDTTHFKVYANIEDANAGENAFTFTSAGTLSHVVAWPATQTFFLEELTFDTFLDCATYYNSTPTSTITGQSRFNAQNVKMVGDGFGFDAQGNNDTVTFEAHGVAVPVSIAYIGFPINTIMEPMPLAIALGGSPRNSTLTRPKHVRSANFMFDNTIGGTINGVPIAIKTFDEAGIGDPPVPARGVFEMSIMKGWDDFNNPTFTLLHNDPFDIRLLGVFYSVDT